MGEFFRKSKEDIVKEIQLNDWEDNREHFSSKFYYILALIQIFLSFHGLFRCPLETLKNGGCAFLIPYTVFTIILGYPIHFMECSLGQYSQLGPIKVWNCVPLGRGIGISSIFLCLLVAFYSNIYAVYALMYISRCFDTVLPWSDCDEPEYKNRTCVPRMSSLEKNQYTASQHYFYDHILQLDATAYSDFHNIGKFIWQQCLAFIYSWLVVYFGVYGSLKSLEKFLAVFVGVCSFCLLVLLSISLQLRGALHGVSVLWYSSDFSHLGNISTWCRAAEVVLLQLGIAQGTLITYGSYAHHRNQTNKDSMGIILLNYAVSLGTCTFVWLFLGSLSYEKSDAYKMPYEFEDFNFVFVLFPEVLGKLNGGRLWCIILFLLVFFSCINSQISLIRTISCSMFDQFPQMLGVRFIFNLALCGVFAFSGIFLCTSNTWVLLEELNEIPNVASRIPIASCAVASIVLIYGINKYCEDLHFLINYYPSFLMRLLFYVVPFLMLGVYVGSSWTLFSPLSDFNPFKFLLYLILIWKPFGFLYWVVRSAINGELRDCWRSLETWGPANEKARVARAYFSSESRVTLSVPWRKKVEC